MIRIAAYDDYIKITVTRSEKVNICEVIRLFDLAFKMSVRNKNFKRVEFHLSKKTTLDKSTEQFINKPKMMIGELSLKLIMTI